MKYNPISPQRGSALGLVMVLLLALSIVMLAITGYVRIAAKGEVQAEAEIKAARAAESAIEMNKANLLKKANELRPGVPSVSDVTDVCNLSSVPTAIYPASAGYTFTRNIAVPIENGVPLTTVDGKFTNLSNDTKTYHYLCESTVTYTPPHGSGMPMTVTMQRAFSHQVIPLFQYAIFYGATPTTAEPGNGDLELNPGANFTVGGRVHANGNLYYGSGATLTYQGIVTYVGSGQNARSPNDPRSGGYGSDATFANGTPSVRPYKVNSISFPCSTIGTAVPNTNQTGPIEFILMPNTTATDPNVQDREYNLAGLKILINSGTAAVQLPDPAHTLLYPRSTLAGTGDCSGTTHTGSGSSLGDSCGFALLTFDGTLIPWHQAAPNAGTYNNLYRLIDAATWTTTQTDNGKRILSFGTAADVIKDFRQDNAAGGRLMNCITLDVSNLAKAVDNPITVTTTPSVVTATIGLVVPTGDANYGTAAGKYLWNGILYIRDLATTTTENTKGVILINGKNLPATIEPTKAPGGGLTVVTDHAAYIVGDYNTGATGTNVPVNVIGSALSAAPTGGGYVKKPAAVMADAITILSRNWVPDTTTGYNTKGLGQRVPISTTVNAAILAGNVPSRNPGNYSGGAENFPRLLEGWGGSGSDTRLTIYGSMICLYKSAQATSPWLNTGIYYDAAPRNWYFEPTFNNPNLLPPGTPNIILFSNGEWVRFENSLN